MSKDLYSEICLHYGIDSVKKLAENRRNRVNNRYGYKQTISTSNFVLIRFVIVSL